MADPVTVSALGVLCWKGLDLAWELVKGAGGNMVYDQAKQAIGLKDKWRNHHVPDAFAVAWRQAVKATRDEYFQQFPNHLGGSMEEAIREGTNALSRPDFIDGWLKQTATAGGFDLTGNLAANWDDQHPERAKSLTTAFRQHMPSMNPTLRHIPDYFFQFWEGAFLHKLMYFFVEAAVKDDPKAWAQIQFNIFRSQCEMLAGIREDTAATRAMTGALGRLVSAHDQLLRAMASEVNVLFEQENPNRSVEQVLEERVRAAGRTHYLLNRAMARLREDDRAGAEYLASAASKTKTTDAALLAQVAAFQTQNLKDVAGARETIVRALQVDPNSADALTALIVHSAAHFKDENYVDELAALWPGFTPEGVDSLRVMQIVRVWGIATDKTPLDARRFVRSMLTNKGVRCPQFEWVSGQLTDNVVTHKDHEWFKKLRLAVKGEIPLADLNGWPSWDEAI